MTRAIGGCIGRGGCGGTRARSGGSSRPGCDRARAGRPVRCRDPPRSPSGPCRASPGAGPRTSIGGGERVRPCGRGRVRPSPRQLALCHRPPSSPVAPEPVPGPPAYTGPHRPAGGGGSPARAVRQCRPMTSRRDRPSQVRPRPPSSGRPRQLPPAPRRPVVARSVGHARSRAGPGDAARGSARPRGRRRRACGRRRLHRDRRPAARRLDDRDGARGDRRLGPADGEPQREPGADPRPAGARGAGRGPTRTSPRPRSSGPCRSRSSGATASSSGSTSRCPTWSRWRSATSPSARRPPSSSENLPLEPGRNDVTATLVGPGGESEPSPVVTYVLDTSKPRDHGHRAGGRRDRQRRDRHDHREDPGQLRRRRPQRGERDVGHRHGRPEGGVLPRGHPAVRHQRDRPVRHRSRRQRGERGPHRPPRIGKPGPRPERVCLPDQCRPPAADHRAHRPGHQPGRQRPLRGDGHVHALHPRRPGHHRRRPERRIGARDVPDDHPGRGDRGKRPRHGLRQHARSSARPPPRSRSRSSSRPRLGRIGWPGGARQRRPDGPPSRDRPPVRIARAFGDARRTPRQSVRAQLPSGHAELALPALPDAAARGRALLGLPKVEHELRHLRPLTDARWRR